LPLPQRICFCRCRRGSAFAVPAADLFLPFFIAIAAVAGFYKRGCQEKTLPLMRRGKKFF
jgi:hypothetical protein